MFKPGLETTTLETIIAMVVFILACGFLLAGIQIISEFFRKK